MPCTLDARHLRVPREKPTKGSRAVVRTAEGLPSYGIEIAIAVAVLTAYLPALGGEFVWDDDAYVTRNHTLRSLQGLWRIWFEPGATPQYYPLVFTTFWIEYHLWGASPVGFHLVNVLLHIANALLLGRILRFLQVPGAVLAAAIFALHPIHVESVAWITERKNVLSGFFYLAALHAYVPAGVLGTQRLSRRTLRITFALFAAALLSKTVTCSLPAAILLLVWWKRGSVTRTDLTALAPFFLLGGVLAAVTVWMERFHVGATGADWDLSLLERVLIAGRALWFYVGKLLWPHPLIFIYPRWTIDDRDPLQYLFPAAAVGVVLALAVFVKRVGCAPVAAVLLFAGTLFPALGFIDVFPMRYSFVADHYAYLASASLIALFTAGLARTLAGVAGAKHAGVAILLAPLMFLTWQGAGRFRDLETLWRDTIAKNPGCWMAHNNLGLLLADRGQFDEAMMHYRKAIEHKPDDAFALTNLGNALAHLGRIEEAVPHFAAALKIDPTHAIAHNSLGNVYAARGDPHSALREFQRAIELRPTYAEAHNNLGNVLAMLGRREEAVSRYRQAIEIDPDYPEPHHNLGVIYLNGGENDAAARHFRAALRLRPNYPEAHYGLGVVYMRQGRIREARDHVREAIRLKPDWQPARDLLAQLADPRIEPRQN